jgi:hypothetical protein
MKMLLIVSTLFLTQSLQQTPSAKTARQIMELVDNSPDGDTRRIQMQMTLTSKSGRSRVRTVLSYAKDYGKDTKKIMQFKKPADVSGTTFLSFEYNDSAKDDDRWIFLPAMRRVKRISGSSKNDYFMGSDFTYDDIGGRDLDDYTYKLLGEVACFGGQCWKIESIAKDPVDAGYSRLVSLIRKDALKAVYAEYYDRDNRLLKKLEVKELSSQKGFWTVMAMEMHNVQSRHKTHLKIEAIDYDIDINESLFRATSIDRVRLK